MEEVDRKFNGYAAVATINRQLDKSQTLAVIK